MHEVRSGRNLRSALRHRLLELTPCGLFAMFMLAAVGSMVAMQGRSVGLLAGCLVMLVIALATLVGWILTAERRIQRCEWLAFEQDFWEYVEADRLYFD
jgi:hypothetical protein